jgi:hypothetical protein
VKLGRGYDAARTTLRGDKKLKTELLKNIRKCMKDEAKGGYTASVASASEDAEVEPGE